MSNEIPDAQRLVPPERQNVAPSAQGVPFAAKVALIAVPIVAGGVALAFMVRSQTASAPDVALNDTRSPLAEELAPPSEESQITIEPLSSDSSPDIATGTDAPFDLNEAYPEIDPNKAPLAVAVNPSVSGLSGDTPDSALDNPSAAAPTDSAAPKGSYGHLPYAENSGDRLTSAGSFVRENYERSELLDFEAAQAFELMRQAAQSQGVNLMPVSGFRTAAAQKELFDSQINRKGSAEAAAEFSAPPGHSEHHTGYAIDITDANVPEADIKQSFENTPAYQWLIQNAHMYGFEESFPKNNTQGVTFEPWHWRYVGSARSQQTFSEARRLYPSR